MSPSGETVPTAKRVAIVYGRHLEVYGALCAFLRSIDLHPVKFPEAHEYAATSGRGAPSILTIVNVLLSNVAAVIVLLTPDDKACLRDAFRTKDDPPHETELTPQPRANVFFEAGMAMALMPGKVVLVRLGNLRLPSDWSGLYFIELDRGEEKIRELVSWLKIQGCQVEEDSAAWAIADHFKPNAEHDALWMAREAMREWLLYDHRYESLLSIPQLNSLRHIAKIAKEGYRDIAAFALASSMLHAHDCVFWANINRQNYECVDVLVPMLTKEYIQPRYRTAFFLQHLEDGIRVACIRKVRDTSQVTNAQVEGLLNSIESRRVGEYLVKLRKKSFDRQKEDEVLGQLKAWHLFPAPQHGAPWRLVRRVVG